MPGRRGNQPNMLWAGLTDVRGARVGSRCVRRARASPYVILGIMAGDNAFVHMRMLVIVFVTSHVPCTGDNA
jgi:hypothetical protein